MVPASTLSPPRRAVPRRVTTEPPFVRWLLISMALVFLGLFLFVPLAAVFSSRPMLVTGGFPAPPALRDEVVDAGALGRVVGTHPTRGFVEQEEELSGMVQRLPVQPDLLRFNPDTGVPFRSAAYRDPAVLNQGAHLAPGAVAEAGEKLVKSSHFRARLGDFQGPEINKGLGANFWPVSKN